MQLIFQVKKIMEIIFIEFLNIPIFKYTFNYLIHLKFFKIRDKKKTTQT